MQNTDRMTGPDPHQSDTHSALLGGALSCVGCRYTLSGMSIRGVCPECGLPVQVSILAAVDPHAERLSPLLRPRVVATCLWLWMLGGVVATVLVLWLRVFDLARRTPWLAPPHRAAEIVVVSMSICGVAMLGLARPIHRTRAIHVVTSVLGAVLMLGAACATWHVLVVVDRHNPPPYVSFSQAVRTRSAARLGVGACVAASLVGVRRNLRLLAARSLLFRQGRADRQTIYALAAVVLLAMVGDAMQLVSFTLSQRSGESVWSIGRYVIAFSSVVFVAGIGAVMLDVVLVSRAILSPPKGLAVYFERTTQSEA